MAAHTTCEVCGTVNVLASGRCMACGQSLPVAAAPRRPVSSPDDSPTATTGPGTDDRTAGTGASATEERTIPVPLPTPPLPRASQDPPTGPTGPVETPPAAAQETIPVPVPVPVPPLPPLRGNASPPPARPLLSPPAAPLPSVPAPAPRPAPAPPAASPARSVDEVQAAAGRRTAIEGAGAGPHVEFDDDALAAAALGPEPAAAVPAPRPAAEPSASRSHAPEDSFTVRLLLPEGDKRMIEVASRPVGVGSGLDEIGLPGDPRARAGEAKVWVEGGRLWIEPAPGSAGVYVRLDGETTLADGDVVLMGDIAAEFRACPHHLPAAAEPVVLGGAAATPHGRLVFLRRDGSGGPVHDLPAGKTILGRTDGHLNFPSDSRLSRRHVRFHATDQGVTVEDLDSRNGTYIRIRSKRRLDVGDALRIGSAGAQIRARS